LCDNVGMSAEVCIWLSPADRAELEGLVADRNTPQKLVWRSRIVLLSAAGNGTMSIMRAVCKSKPSVWRWQERYLAQGIGGLQRDASRPGRKPPLTAQVIAEVVEKTLREKPPAATHWSTRTMAHAVSLSHTSVQRIWNAHGLKPHLTRGFKLSNDKQFVEKVQDVVGLAGQSLGAQRRREKSGPGARPHPAGAADEKGRAGTMTHDYKRHGTTSLFAALDVATGAVIGQCMKRHRRHEFLRFLRTIHRQTPQKLDLHLILDNYATHKHSNVKTWLAKHPRFHLHFTRAKTKLYWIILEVPHQFLIPKWFHKRGRFRRALMVTWIKSVDVQRVSTIRF
jgi:transposase